MHNPERKGQVSVGRGTGAPRPCYEATQPTPGVGSVERIVVGTDLSQRSSAAVTMAAELAGQLGATLHLVSACPMPAVGMGPEMVVVPDHGEVVDSTKADLDQMAADLRRQGLDGGDPHPGRRRRRRALRRGRDGRSRPHRRRQQAHAGAARLLGSVPNRVAHKATCSVLIAAHRLSPRRTGPPASPPIMHVT